MIRFLEFFSLKPYNSFGVEAHADFFFEFTESQDLLDFMEENSSFDALPRIVLGGGSNYLFTKDFKGLVLHPNIPGIRVLEEQPDYVLVEAGAGVEWDDFVAHCVNNGWGGVENLSLIPGKTGAAPVQNIGAYGAEAKDVIETVYTIDIENRKRVGLSNADCAFGYRDSIFKQGAKGKYVVTSVVFRLSHFPLLDVSYGALAEEVEKLGGKTLHNVRQAVINIRRSKLPEPEKLGNAGSFFMNPVVDTEVAVQLKKEYPGMPVYPAGEGKTKLAAGWLIEQCGWKGYRNGDAGVHQHQALVLVNYGAATGQQLFELSEAIKKSVKQQFGIVLNREVIVL